MDRDLPFRWLVADRKFHTYADTRVGVQYTNNFSVLTLNILLKLSFPDWEFMEETSDYHGCSFGTCCNASVLELP